MPEKKRFGFFKHRPSPVPLPEPEYRYLHGATEVPFGTQEMRKATVSCFLLGGELRHGDLKETQSSIFFLDFRLKEADHAKFRAVTFELKVQSDPSLRLCPDCGPQLITEHVYPRNLEGPPTTIIRQRKLNLNMTVDGAGVSVVTPGWESAGPHQKTRRWTFQGNPRAENQSSYIRQGTWEWMSNTNDSEHHPKPNYYGAMVVRQTTQSLVFTCNIFGTLKERNAFISPVEGQCIKQVKVGWATEPCVDFEKQVKNLEAKVTEWNKKVATQQENDPTATSRGISECYTGH